MAPPTRQDIFVRLGAGRQRSETLIPPRSQIERYFSQPPRAWRAARRDRADVKSSFFHVHRLRAKSRDI